MFYRRARTLNDSGVGNKKLNCRTETRDRAMFRVVEYFAKSLKVTQGHWK